MENLCSSLIAQLKDHQFQQTTSGVTQFQSECQMSAHLLSWLKAQSLYPQFYLNFRQSALRMATIGKVRSFFDEKSAQAFVQAQNLQLVGGLTFDKQVNFWLPRLVLTQEGDKVIATLYIDNEKNIVAEQEAALTALKNIAKFTALEPIQQKVRWIGQKANQQTWCHWVEQALDEIEKGTFTKVVLANENQFETVQPLDAKDFIAESEQQNTGCYHFLLALDEHQSFVGSTPERLYQRHGTELNTEALAGTAMVSEDPLQTQQQADWLLNDPKNDHENLLVVKDICDNLANYVEDIHVAPVEVKRLRRVQHLRRAIQGQLKSDFSDVACLTAIHPTAAVSGLPQQSAVQFLQKTENFDRSWYAGTLGVMSQLQSEFCVTIRSAFIEQNKIRVFAGAGIVAGSVPLLEWNEIERKASGLVSLLAVEKE
ncbi:isochorismate synthase [Pasteurellaceae bacterium 22721_9_1]